MPLIPSAPVEPLSSLVALGSSQWRRVSHGVNVKQGDAKTQLVYSVKPLVERFKKKKKKEKTDWELTFS